MEGEEIPEIAERGGSSMRSREWCLEAYSELEHQVSVEKQVRMWLLYTRGAISFVPLGNCVAGGKSRSSAFELVVSPLLIGFPAVITEEDPGIATLAQPTVCFDLQGRFLNTGSRVKREARFQITRSRTLF